MLLILVLLGASYWHRARLHQRLCQLKGPSCQYRFPPPCCQLPPQPPTPSARPGTLHLCVVDPRGALGCWGHSPQGAPVLGKWGPRSGWSAPLTPLIGPRPPTHCSARAGRRGLTQLQGHMWMEAGPSPTLPFSVLRAAQSSPPERPGPPQRVLLMPGAKVSAWMPVERGPTLARPAWALGRGHGKL